MKGLRPSALALLFFATPALADDGLYEDVFDPSSSFVRVVAPGQSVASIDGTTVRDLEEGVSKFVNVMPGPVEVVLPGGTAEIDVGPSAHYTVVLNDDGTHSVITDEIANSPAKADISLYNLTEIDELELYVPAANAAAIADIAPSESQTVAVRAPLTLDFEVRAEGDVLAEVSEVGLVRRAGVSIVVMETEGIVTAFVTDNAYLK